MASGRTDIRWSPSPVGVEPAGEQKKVRVRAPSKSLTKSPPSEMSQKFSNANSMTGSESDSPSSRSPAEKIATIESPKLIRRRLSRSPHSEEKNQNRMAELESQLSQLQEDLNKTKEQLGMSKSQKRRAQKEFDEAKNHLTEVTGKLKDSEALLQEISDAEDERINELRKIGQERDRAWQSELEAIRKQQSADSAALVAAVNELHRLRIRCEMLQTSEAAHAEKADKATSELQDLQREMSEAVCLVGDLRFQIEEFKKSEAGYQELINVSHLQLEMAKETIATLQTEHMKLTETLSAVSRELDENKAQVRTLEEVIKQMKAEEMAITRDSTINKKPFIESELEVLRFEVEQLYSALEAAEISWHEEQIRSTVQVQSSYEALHLVKINSGLREAMLESMLQEVKAEIAKARMSLLDKENVIQGLCDLNKRLILEKRTQQENEESQSYKLKGLTEELLHLKANVMDKENALRSIVEENALLKVKIKKQSEGSPSSELLKEVDQARAAEQEALTKLDIVTQVADKNNKEVIMLSNQLVAARAENLQTEAELNRLTVQLQQWKKAADVAMTILSSEENTKRANSTGGFDSNYIFGDKNIVNSASLEDDETEPLKKKNGNMLKRFGVLLKKGQK